MTTVLTPRTTTVVLFQGDDLDPLNEKADAVERVVRRAGPARVGDTSLPGAEQAAAFDEFMDAAVERAAKVKLAAMGRREYRVLLNAHPPRMVDTPEGPVPDQEDAKTGFNRDTFCDILVPTSIELGRIEDGDDDQARAALLEQIRNGTYHPAADIVEFADSLSDGDFSKLYAASVSLNQSPGGDPKVRLSSHFDQISDETSSSPARLA